MTIETILFDNGINRKKSTLFLEEGELYLCSGFTLNISGELICRDEITQSYSIDMNTSLINGIHRYVDSIIASSKSPCPGNQAYFNYIYQRDVNGTSFNNIALLSGNSRPSFIGFEKFIFSVDGEGKKAFIDENAYDWGVPNPEVATVLTAGAAGNPDGEYYCYVTFNIIFPNDKVVETGPSPVSSITVSSQAIEWSNIATSNYEGNELIIYRKLYRTVSGVPYLVTTLTDNTQTTFTDDITDATLQLSSIMSTSGYDVPTDGMTDITVHLQRIFGIKDNKLYWSEAYAPFIFTTTNDVTVSKDGEDLIKILSWGNQLFMCSSETWRRLQGTVPDTWAIKSTFADTGGINKDTIKITKYGILSLWYDGLYIFDGSVTKNITEKILGIQYFLDVSDWSTAYAEYDGQIYSLYFDADADGELDTCLKIDFSYYPDIRCYNSDFIPTSHYYYVGEGIHYLAFGGYEYNISGTETIESYFQTRDMAFKDIIQKKNLEYLYYDINTGGKDATITFYVDGVSSYSMTLNTSSRQRKRSEMLPQMEGYMFHLKLECDDSAGLVIYGPWALSATIVGT